jgi:hypothetical protein
MNENTVTEKHKHGGPGHKQGHKPKPPGEKYQNVPHTSSIVIRQDNQAKDPRNRVFFNAKK